MARVKKHLEVDVLTASRERISYLFDNFERIVVSFSGGKDSTVMLHLAAEEARKRGRIIGVMIVDLEAQYTATAEHLQKTVDEYADCIGYVCQSFSGTRLPRSSRAGCAGVRMPRISGFARNQKRHLWQTILFFSLEWSLKNL